MNDTPKVKDRGQSHFHLSYSSSIVNLNRKDRQFAFSSVSSFEGDNSSRLTSLRGRNAHLTVGDSTGEELHSSFFIGSQIRSIPLPLDQSDH